MKAVIIASIVWLIFSCVGGIYFAPMLTTDIETATSNTGGEDDVVDDEDQDDTLISEVLDMYEKKVSEQGDRFDASNGILVGVLGAQIAVFVFYADVFAKSFKGSPDYWFVLVLAILLAGVIIIGWLLFSSEYRPAPKPNLFAENAVKDGIREARRTAIEDLDSAYTENRVGLYRRRNSLGWILIITTIAILVSLVIQSVEERTPRATDKANNRQEDGQKALGSSEQRLFVSDWPERPQSSTGSRWPAGPRLHDRPLTGHPWIRQQRAYLAEHRSSLHEKSECGPSSGCRHSE